VSGSAAFAQPAPAKHKYPLPEQVVDSSSWELNSKSTGFLLFGDRTSGLVKLNRILDLADTVAGQLCEFLMPLLSERSFLIPMFILVCAMP